MVDNTNVCFSSPLKHTGMRINLMMMSWLLSLYATQNSTCNLNTVYGTTVHELANWHLLGTKHQLCTRQRIKFHKCGLLRFLGFCRTRVHVLRQNQSGYVLHQHQHRISLFCCQYLLAANPVIVLVALHGVVKLPEAVQVKLKEPPSNVVVLVLDTTTPSLSVHW